MTAPALDRPAAAAAIMLVTAAIDGSAPLDQLVHDLDPDVDVHVLIGSLVGIAHGLATGLDSIDPGTSRRWLAALGLTIARGPA